MNQVYTILFSISLLIGSLQVVWAQTDQNTSVGYQAGMSLTSGQGNTFLGYQSGLFNTTASNNLFIGNQSGYKNTSGNGNSFIGFQAGYNNTTGLYNAFIGFAAGQANTTGGYNSFIGYDAGLSNTTGSHNMFLGTYSGYTNSTGEDNAFIGHATGIYNTTGTGNAFVGTYAGYNNTTGTGNAFVGIRAGANTTTANGNTFLGGAAGYGNTTGGQNTYIGQNAGYTGNALGTNNVFIGTSAGVNAESTIVNNAAAIGANAIVTQSNSIVLGGTGANAVNVGIGTTAPANKLQITQGTAGNSGLRFTNLTSATTPIYSTNQFLTVNSSGDVVLATVSASKGAFRAAADSLTNENWNLSATGHLQNTNLGGVVIGSGIPQTPAGYKLYVTDGILTEKVKVAVKNTSDWSDHVFEPGYPLKGLSEVADFIQFNKHLPGILSAQEMVEKGNDLHKTDAKLLEKIEELTLYLIQQKGELEDLRQQNQQMKNRLEALETKTNH